MKLAQDSDENLSTLLQYYCYQPELTAKLDGLGQATIDQKIVDEIVLWKVNRYASLAQEALSALNSLIAIEPGKHNEAAKELSLLLRQRGVDLPMASTLMRFRNPKAFQIIDRHAYRAVTGNDYPLHTNSSIQQKIDTYFAYLDILVELTSSKRVDFQSLDRILYIFDKRENGKL
jgi:thermostable 8-oxoguanine DNA glycosylase